MAKYRKKPIEVEAIFNDGTSKRDDEIREWSDGKVRGHWSGKHFATDNGGHRVVVKQGAKGFNYLKGILEYSVETLHGTVTAEYGDWIVKGPSGDFWPVKPDIFEETYEKVQP